MTSPKLRSLGRRTDLLFIRFTGEVIDRGEYLVLRTPSNPTYHWGNYLVFRTPPRPGDYRRWSELFELEFSSGGCGVSHRLFAWDGIDGELGASEEFVLQGMRLDQGVVLSTRTVVSPLNPNDEITVRAIRAEHEWRAVIEQQIRTRETAFSEQAYRTFKQRQFQSYRDMSRAGLGHWYGAFIGEQLVADLGIFHEDGVARFQSVETHPAFRRRGICATLVQQSASLLREETEIGTFVMEADPDYHAARIYESVGFRPVERNSALCWYPEM